MRKLRPGNVKSCTQNDTAPEVVSPGLDIVHSALWYKLPGGLERSFSLCEPQFPNLSNEDNDLSLLSFMKIHVIVCVATI